MKNSLLSGVAALVLLAACAGVNETPQSDTPTAETTTEAVSQPANVEDSDARVVVTTAADEWGEWGVDLTTRATDTHAGDDFYHHVNGAWLDSFEIPADRSRYGAFTLLAEKSEQRVRFIIEDLAESRPDASTIEGKIAAYYNAFMDTDAIEAAGLTPVQPLLDQVENIQNRNDLARAFAANGFASPLGGWVDVDSKDTENYIFYINQGGLTLGDRDYYLVESERNSEILAAYTTLLENIFGQLGYQDPGGSAQNVIALEREIAKAHWDRAAGRNRNLTYNKVSIAELSQMGGGFPINTLLNEFGVGEQQHFIIRQVTPTAEEIEELGLSEEQVAKVSGGGMEGILEVAATHDLSAWKAWLSARLLISHSEVLPASVDDAVFELFGKTLSGQEVQRDRWKRGVSAVEGALGEGIGQVYAARYFPPENKAAMDELVANLRLAMSANLTDMTWMGDATKVEAQDKLDSFTPKIGYTEKFETYDTLAVGDGSAWGNMMAASDWAYKDMLSQLGQPIDRTEWFMLPQTVNAYYSPNRNEIVFPAAILQPPFFNISADPAVNYGAIGGVIGHELGHGFDDQGAKSDGTGTLRDWWTDEDKAAFEGLTSALVEQYNGFCPLDEGETCVNGQLTLGENIGDVGGLSMAYRAYKMSLNGEEAPVIDGLTGDQRFFISWAQVWRAKYREEATRRQLQTDPHSPPRYRVNGVVRNFDEWYEAFDIGPDHALYLPPEERIRIW